tara:strand:- start:585 stop:695 length:111 start_codon:yes stop_codon:yes gene_type:complete
MRLNAVNINNSEKEKKISNKDIIAEGKMRPIKKPDL